MASVDLFPNTEHLDAVVYMVVQKDYASDFLFGYAIQVENMNMVEKSRQKMERLNVVKSLSPAALWQGTEPNPPDTVWHSEYQQFILSFCNALAEVINFFSLTNSSRVLFCSLTRSENGWSCRRYVMLHASCQMLFLN